MNTARRRKARPATDRAWRELRDLEAPATVLHIARWARCSPRTVRNLLAELDADGDLITDTSHGYPYRYWLGPRTGIESGDRPAVS